MAISFAHDFRAVIRKLFCVRPHGGEHRGLRNRHGDTLPRQERQMLQDQHTPGGNFGFDVKGIHICLKISPTLVAAEVTRPKYPGFPGGERRQSEPPHVGCYVFVASGVSRIICLRRAFDKLRKTRKLEPTHVGCYYSNRLKKISALFSPFPVCSSPHHFFCQVWAFRVGIAL